MYTDFFGFVEKPFNPSPDPKFLYLSPYHEEALKGIIYGIHERLGIFSVTGEVGTGKTTVLYTALHWLSESTRIAFLTNCKLEFDDLLRMILSELNIANLNDRLSKIEALEKLKQFSMEQLSIGGTVALIVDEAQNLSKEDLEQVRLLSNIETPSDKLVQIILTGQPELDQKLEDSDLRQLKQRIYRRFHLKTLDPDQTYDYIRHRLKLVSCLNGDFFNASTTDEVWLHTEGVPRKINILCDNVLRMAFERKLRVLDPALVSAAACELHW